MIRLTHHQLEHGAGRRAPGYAEAFKARAKLLPTHIEIEAADLEAVNLAFPVLPHVQSSGRALARPETNAAPREAVPQPLKTWPFTPFGVAARTLKLLATPEDAGVGDTIARVIGPLGGDAYKAWFVATFGKPCGCQDRQDKINETFPYEKTD